MKCSIRSSSSSSSSSSCTSLMLPSYHQLEDALMSSVSSKHHTSVQRSPMSYVCFSPSTTSSCIVTCICQRRHCFTIIICVSLMAAAGPPSGSKSPSPHRTRPGPNGPATFSSLPNFPGLASEDDFGGRNGIWWGKRYGLEPAMKAAACVCLAFGTRAPLFCATF
jgi:hypothetical protein